MATVLIVEDDPAMIRVLEDNFRMTGYDVLTARDGPQGLETTLKERPDLVILDIMLRLFLRKAGCPLSRDEIRTAVWGYSHFISLRDIDKTVALLNEKIESDPTRPPRIETIGNTGYKFEMP